MSSFERPVRRAFLLVVPLLLLLLAATARAGMFDDDEARKQVAETKRRVEDVNRQLDARIVTLETTVKSQGLLDLFTQVEALKADLANLRGQIEVLSNEMDTTQKRQRDLYVDLDTRMRKVETAQQAAAAAAAAMVAVPVPGTVLPPPAGAAGAAGVPGAAGAAGMAGATDPAGAQQGAFVPGVSASGAAGVAPGANARPGGAPAGDALAEQRAYDAALDQFKSGNYAASLQSFVGFVKMYPKSPLAPSAQYWVGNGYYALKDYRSAITSQRLLISMYPDSQKVPDALLNISSSQIELADTAGAKRTLDDLVLRYPASEAADRAKKRLTGAR
jgi:tol-pal system protein YbgF